MIVIVALLIVRIVWLFFYEVIYLGNHIELVFLYPISKKPRLSFWGLILIIVVAFGTFTLRLLSPYLLQLI